MGSQAKKDAFELWKKGESLRQIQFAMKLLHGTSMKTVKKWVVFWNRKARKTNAI